MKNYLRNALRGMDATGGPAARLDAMARTAKNLLGTTRAIDLAAIAAYIREREPVIAAAEADTALLDSFEALMSKVQQESDRIARSVVIVMGPESSWRDAMYDALNRGAESQIVTLDAESAP